MGSINFYGPKHSGSFAVTLARADGDSGARAHCHQRAAFNHALSRAAARKPRAVWVQFVGVILALSGVEAIANLTG